jgi:hypothetical protein
MTVALSVACQAQCMESFAARALVSSGIVLLALAALTGFLQARHAPDSPEHALWRVVHTGGTAGAVQLIALGAVLDHFAARLPDLLRVPIVIGVALATWAFFIGPALRAAGAARAGRAVTLFGAVVAGPAYVALPLLALA